jgi:hypothetical protein
MSRKHFIALASALAAASPNIPREAFMDLVQAIADACASQSTTFNRQRFVDAAFSEIEQ